MGFSREASAQSDAATSLEKPDPSFSLGKGALDDKGIRRPPLSRRTALVGLGIGSFAFASHTLLSASAQGAEDSFVYPDLTITSVEYAFEMPATAEAGLTHVILDNQGMMGHHAMFLRPVEGSTIEDIQAALDGGDFGAIFATAVSVGGPNVDAGLQASVVMNLEVGQYLVVCIIPTEEGIPHFALGMQAVLEVTEGSADSTPPEADITVNLIEMTFDGLPADASAGAHVVEVTNTGTQLHEIVFQQLADGMTIEQGLQLFIEPSPSAPPVASPVAEMHMGPPYELIGGIAPMSPGETNYAVPDLAAGNYIAICFIQDPETGMPHFAMGMIAGFSVS